MSSPNRTITLIGNPNAGKTTIFNALTGSKQTVGNWPGVTVERKCGRYQFQQNIVKVVDLPGTYYLSHCHDTVSIDESIACEVILAKEADLIVNIIDASNLERNLYLTLQLLELGVPVLVVLNMMDIVKSRGTQLKPEVLQSLLRCPVVAVDATKPASTNLLKQAIHDCTLSVPAEPIRYGRKIESAISQLKKVYPNAKRYQLIEALEYPITNNTQAPEQVAAVREQLEAATDQAVDVAFAAARYAVIESFLKKVTCTQHQKSLTVTKVLDKIVLNRLLGLPIFLLVMYAMFFFAINIGGAFQDCVDIGSDVIFIQGVSHLLAAWHVPGWLIAFLAAGVGKGINTVITFIPVIGAMFLFLAFLQGSGYMARAAFVVDRFMRAIGLPGKSFVPMIVGFGCNVPAIMGCRTLENKRDRILTILMTPFMSCGARLAIFAVFTSAFFQTGGALVVFGLYIIGVLMAVATGVLLRKTLLQGDASPLVMELPPYHFPSLKSLLLQAWHRLKVFLFKAGKIIIPVCIIISALNAVNFKGELVDAQHKSQSVLSVVGQTITPAFKPIGIQQDNWPATLGLVTGMLAKEVVVGTLNTLYVDVGHLHQAHKPFNLWQDLKAAAYTVPENLSGLGSALSNPILASQARTDPIAKGVFGQMSQRFGSKISAFAYLLFILLYVPCISTVAVMTKELNRGWAIFSVAWSTGMAYAVSTVFYQAATFAKHPMSSASWILLMIGLFIGTISCLKFTQKKRKLSVCLT